MGQINGATFECTYYEDIEYGKTCLLRNLTDQSGFNKEVVFRVPTDYKGRQTSKADFKLIHIAFNSSVNSVPVEIFKEFKNAEAIKVHQAKLSKLDGNAFRYATKLKNLQIRGNDLQKITIEDVKYLENLEKLDLENNPISYIDPKIFDHMKKLKLVDLRRTKCVNLKFHLISEADFLNMKEKLRNCFNMSDIFAPTLNNNFDARIKTTKPEADVKLSDKFDARKSLLGVATPAVEATKPINPKVLDYIEKMKEANARRSKCISEAMKLINEGDFTKLKETFKNCFNMSDLFPPKVKPLKALFDARETTTDFGVPVSLKSLLATTIPDDVATMNPKVLDYIEKIKEARARRAKCISEALKLINDGDFAKLNETFKNCFNMSDLFPPKVKPLKALFDARETTTDFGVPFSPKTLLATTIPDDVATINPKVLDYIEKIKEASARRAKCISEAMKLINEGDFAKLNETFKNCFNMSDIFPSKVKPLKGLFDARKTSADFGVPLSPKSLLATEIPDDVATMNPKVLDYLEKIKEANQRIMVCLNESMQLIKEGNFAKLNETFATCFNMSDIFPPKSKTIKDTFDARLITSTLTQTQPISSTFDVRGESSINLNDVTLKIDNPLKNLLDVRQTLASSLFDEKTTDKLLNKQFDGAVSLMEAQSSLKSIQTTPLKSTFDTRQLLSSDSQAKPKSLTQTFGEPLKTVIPPGRKPITTTTEPSYIEFKQKDVFDFLIQNYMNNLQFATDLVIGTQSEFFWILFIVCMVFLAIEVYLIWIKRQGGQLYVQIPSNE